MTDKELTAEELKKLMHNLRDVPILIADHIEKIVKDRTIIITGDTDHMSIDWTINKAFKNINAPRKYDFQEENVNELEVIRTLHRYVPDFLSATSYPYDKVVEAIAGDCGMVLKGSYDLKCYDCAERLNMMIKGNHIHLTCDKPCANNKIAMVEIDFPTGEIVIGDWPDRFSEAKDAGFIHEDEGESINYLKGQRMRTDQFAEQQIFHHFVGNTCPSLLSNTKTNELKILGHAESETNPEGFKEIGSFCTDLWWVTMIDRKFYDMMMVKLPEKRDTKYYEKSLEVVKIKPGRYRFTCYNVVDSDDYTTDTVYATAEWIGEASDFIPKYESLNDDEKIMSVEEAVSLQILKHYKTHPIHRETVKFRLFDNTFNVIGNGIDSKGEFYSNFKIKIGTEIPESVPCTTVEAEFKRPYPCFEEKYSLIYKIDLNELPIDWILGLEWFYTKCKEYFLAGAEDYHYAYPPVGKNEEANAADTKDFQKAIDKYRKDGMSDSDFYAAVTKAYGWRYRGNLHDFRLGRWEQERLRCIKFIEKTLKKLLEHLVNT